MNPTIEHINMEHWLTASLPWDDADRATEMGIEYKVCASGITNLTRGQISLQQYKNNQGEIIGAGIRFQGTDGRLIHGKGFSVSEPNNWSANVYTPEGFVLAYCYGGGIIFITNHLSLGNAKTPGLYEYLLGIRSRYREVGIPALDMLDRQQLMAWLQVPAG